MALAKTLRFGQQLLLIGNGAEPEVFAPLCGFTSLNLTVNIETSSTNIPDCEDPDLPAWLASDEVSKQMVLGGQGVLDTDAVQIEEDWILEGGEKNFRWLREGSAANGGGYWSAPGILSTYEQTGERGQRWNRNVGITLNGRPTFTPAV
jgi:hypothetical protein